MATNIDFSYQYQYVAEEVKRNFFGFFVPIVKPCLLMHGHFNDCWSMFLGAHTVFWVLKLSVCGVRLIILDDCVNDCVLD